ncbi:hypothetical protein HispidOSU_017026, partial [Sigmodon hispidus]
KRRQGLKRCHTVLFFQKRSLSLGAHLYMLLLVYIPTLLASIGGEEFLVLISRSFTISSMRKYQ